ncbi:uncharacterized protein BDZ99DRAFT_523619 [Mytilinidion resinicola]|uniref:WW domain-containing protein n=1 Tax=Mytilinidion resinicola TaxID=574789 RepID=A0A6A6YBS1_9PEZI|nr:uncharacterized protein BDZ99DRAFT_523619 [Mytilinidion resinicola]KAF2806150.1 hypothetical protein BDZ99DRAFT_523619 [Mytilinidion resinicola]
MTTAYNLGPMVGGRIHQYANSAGQVYYVDSVANTTSYAIPNGFGDAPGCCNPSPTRSSLMSSWFANYYRFDSLPQVPKISPATLRSTLSTSSPLHTFTLPRPRVNTLNSHSLILLPDLICPARQRDPQPPSQINSLVMAAQTPAAAAETYNKFAGCYVGMGHNLDIERAFFMTATAP